MLDQIPVVDRTADQRTFRRTILQAFEEIGFVFVKAEALTAKLPRVFEAFRMFFTLPDDVKCTYARPDLSYQRGWTPPFTEVGNACRGKGPDGTDLADAKENYFMGPELINDETLVKRYPTLYPDNIWPSETPELRMAMHWLYYELLAVGMDVLVVLEQGLGLEQDLFVNMVTDGPTVLRAIHYPPVTVEQIGNIVWACKHTDINLVTVLPASTRSGLWIRRRDGEWIPGSAPQGCVIVQAADMLQHLTNGELISATHEVRAPQEPTKEGRLSAALFIHPCSDTLLTPVMDGAVRYKPITAGDFLSKRLRKINLERE